MFCLPNHSASVVWAVTVTTCRTTIFFFVKKRLNLEIKTEATWKQPDVVSGCFIPDNVLLVSRTYLMCFMAVRNVVNLIKISNDYCCFAVVFF